MASAEEQQPKPVVQPPPINTELVSTFKLDNDKIIHANMTKLTRMNEYTINNKQFKRKILKPKELIEFSKFQDELTTVGDTDIAKKFEILEKMAIFILEGFTSEDFENSDAVYLEQVIAACFLITKGFREV